MSKLQDEIGKARFTGIENAWILVSGRWGKEKRARNAVKINISFLYQNDGVAAEWEPVYGPIQIWHRCDKDAEGATEHYFYDYVNNDWGNWSQLAVERAGLQGAFVRGDYGYIYATLQRWAND